MKNEQISYKAGLKIWAFMTFLFGAGVFCIGFQEKFFITGLILTSALIAFLTALIFMIGGNSSVHFWSDDRLVKSILLSALSMAIITFPILIQGHAELGKILPIAFFAVIISLPVCLFVAAICGLKYKPDSTPRGFFRRNVISLIVIMIFVGAIGGITSLYFTLSFSILERDKTALFMADLSQTELQAKDINFIGPAAMYLPDSRVIRLNDEIVIYARLHSHHTWQHHGGYTFLRVNDKAFRGAGPCGPKSDLRLPDKPIEVLREAEFVDFLIADGFHEIESNK